MWNDLLMNHSWFIVNRVTYISKFLVYKNSQGKSQMLYTEQYVLLVLKWQNIPYTITWVLYAPVVEV